MLNKDLFQVVLGDFSFDNGPVDYPINPQSWKNHWRFAHFKPKFAHICPFYAQTISFLVRIRPFLALSWPKINII